MPRVEGSVEEDAPQHVDRVVQQQAGNKSIPIPDDLSEGYRTLLATTEADWEHRTVQGIMCRVCLGHGFKNWRRSKRHCDTAEAHPLTIAFCHRCGDFFARRDALDRHHKKSPRNCRNAKSDMAKRKRRETEKVHKDLMERLERCAKTGEEVGMHFAEVIKSLYPESSKKRTGRRKQS